jgi:hypothetical protein
MGYKQALARTAQVISKLPPALSYSKNIQIPMALTIDSTVTLSSGHKMPLLGFGVFQNSNAKPSTLEAFKAGYRYVQFYEADYFILIDTYITPTSHVDSAQMYGNEAQVADAVRASGLDRGDVFISAYI